MRDIFLVMLRLSFQVSVIILAILILRMLLSKTKRNVICFLWVFVAIRLVCPVLPESGFSLTPQFHYLDSEIVTAFPTEQSIHVGNDAPDMSFTPESGYKEERSWVNQPDKLSIASNEKGTFKLDLFDVLSYIWLAGIVAILGYTLISYQRVKKKICGSLLWKENIYHCDQIDTPFILGLFHIRIYLPATLSDKERVYILLHEKAHIQRKDALWKLFAYLILMVYWFHPLVWISYYLFIKDVELACDEKVVSNLKMEERKEYAFTLLNCSVENKDLITPLAFGEQGVKTRIKAIMKYKKPGFWMLVVALVAVVIVMVLFLTNPKENPAEQEPPITQENEEIFTPEEEKTGSEKTENENTGNENPLETTQPVSEPKVELTIDMLLKMYHEKTLKDFDPSLYSNVEYIQEREGDVYYEAIYVMNGRKYTVSFDWYQTVLDRITVRNEQEEVIGLYFSDSKYRVTEDPESFFEQPETKLSDFLTISLPEPYEIGAYSGDIGVAGGAVILPEAYNLVADGIEFAYDPAWRYAGCITMIPDAKEWFTYADGIVQEKPYRFWNHTSEEKIKVISDLTKDGSSIILYYSNHDLYTGPDLYELEEKGMSFAEDEVTSDFWDFYITKEGSDRAYMISLCSKLFSQEEAERIIATVEIKGTW